MMYAVGVGEMFDAVNFHGPFKEFEDAADWAEAEVGMRASWWVVQLEVPEQKDPSQDLVLIENVDMNLLKQQHEVLASLLHDDGTISREDMQLGILDGVLDMIGDMLPYPQSEDEARICRHGNKVWFGHECGLCMES